MKNLRIINEKEIPVEIYNTAFNLCQDIDENDTLFIACSMFLNAKLWTSDKKLITGLNQKGFFKLITTDELIKK
ncbi:MAG: hypothetical protein A2Y41_06520 [Spirochaetes bacterium GWB1_36_13]|nr:MAG: hypothetical protein A2Y41_06520 [Spirochaetes bacterium GWB1_36_13]